MTTRRWVEVDYDTPGFIGYTPHTEVTFTVPLKAEVDKDTVEVFDLPDDDDEEDKLEPADDPVGE
jgi:hypothetical protein